jgi:hypothetical protein
MAQSLIGAPPLRDIWVARFLIAFKWNPKLAAGMWCVCTRACACVHSCVRACSSFLHGIDVCVRERVCVCEREQ